MPHHVVMVSISGWCRVILAFSLSAVAARGQAERYELGRRFIMLEAVAAERSEPEQRARIAEFVDRALSDFFSANIVSATRSIDEARLHLEYDGSIPDGMRWAASLRVSTPASLFDAATEHVELTLEKFYDVEESRPADATMSVRVPSKDGPVLVSSAVSELPLRVAVPVPGPGDHRIDWELRAGERVLVRRSRLLSFATNLEGRLAKLDGRIDRRKVRESTEASTAQALMRRCRAMTRSRPQEIDYPGARLLREAEAVADAVAKSETYFDTSRPGEHWVRFVVRGRQISCRVFVPERKPDGPRPALVFGLHGAGGSENLFFEGENGLTPKLCDERGWMLVATRGTPLRPPPLSGLIEILGERYDFDPDRVFVVGHSMGAMQSRQIVSRDPAKFTAVAALGGGGEVRASDAFRELRLFVGVGERDFLKDGARGLARAAEAAGASVTFKEYAEVGHVLIVQDALCDVFSFFDSCPR